MRLQFYCCCNSCSGSIHSKCFRNYLRFELSRVNLSQSGAKIDSSYQEFREIGGKIIELG